MPTQTDLAPAPSGTPQRVHLRLESEIRARDGRFRPELQGLRALAILMVVVYHVWVGRPSGGVDVFLLISTFLLTLSMARRVGRGGSLNLLRYWTHVFKRLLPAAAVVILAIGVGGWWFLPATEWASLWSHAWSSLFYFENWRLIADQVDYYAAVTTLPSPYQHFWSLSIQGQVFLLWPLVFAAAMVVGRRWGTRVARGVMFGVFGLVFVASLAWSVFSTTTQQEIAYFDTAARLWEFAFGSLLALVVVERQLPRALGVAAGWVGVGLLLATGVVIDVAGAFPGYVALWPLGAAALVIAAGRTGSAFGVDRILSHPLAVRLGDWSYGLYLVHWPVLIYWRAATGGETPDLGTGSAIILGSLALGWLLTVLVDRPLRRWRWAGRSALRSLVVVAAAIGLVAAPLGAWQGAVADRLARAQAASNLDNPGALSHLEGFVPVGDPEAPVIPDPEAIHGEWVAAGPACRGDAEPSDPAVADKCSVTRASETASRSVLMVGNSHAQQLLAPFKVLARDHDWNLRAVLAPGCVLGEAPYEEWNEDFDCERVAAGMVSYIEQWQPDVVVTVGSFVFWNDPQKEVLVGGLDEITSEILANGSELIVLRDNPRFGRSPVACVLEEGVDADECRRLAEDVYAATSPLDRLSQPEVFTVDLSPHFCPEGVCEPIIGNMYVYLDSHHVTRTFGRTLSFFVEEQLAEQGFTF